MGRGLASWKAQDCGAVWIGWARGLRPGWGRQARPFIFWMEGGGEGGRSCGGGELRGLPQLAVFG